MSERGPLWAARLWLNVERGPMPDRQGDRDRLARQNADR